MTIAPHENPVTLPPNLTHSPEAWQSQPTQGSVVDFLRQYFRLHSTNPETATIKLPRNLGSFTGKPSECRTFGPYFTAALIELDGSLHHIAQPSPNVGPHSRSSIAEGQAVFGLLHSFRQPNDPEWHLNEAQLNETMWHPNAQSSALVQLGHMALEGLEGAYPGAERIARQAVQALSVAATREVAAIPRQMTQQ